MAYPAGQPGASSSSHLLFRDDGKLLSGLEHRRQPSCLAASLWAGCRRSVSVLFPSPNPRKRLFSPGLGCVERGLRGSWRGGRRRSQLWNKETTRFHCPPRPLASPARRLLWALGPGHPLCHSVGSVFWGDLIDRYYSVISGG